MSRAWKAFNYYMDVYPLTSNIAAAGFLYGAGDIICQGIEIYKYGFVVSKAPPPPPPSSSELSNVNSQTENVKKSRRGYLSINLETIHQESQGDNTNKSARANAAVKEDGANNSIVDKVSPNTISNSNTNILWDEIIQRLDIFDYGRIFRMTMYGTFIFGLTSFYWYEILDKYLGHLNRHAQVFGKVAIDEVVYAPLSIVSLFGILSYFEGKDGEQIVHKIKQDFWPTFFVDILVWPALQAINFYFMPLKFRVLYISVCSLFWNVFLSSMHNGAPPSMEQELITVAEQREEL